MIAYRKNQSGTILLAVIMLLLLIPVTVLLVFDTTSAKSAAVDTEITHIQLDAVLDAAIAHARYQADVNTSCTGFTSLPVTGFGNHTYQVNVIQDASRPSLLHLTAQAQLDSGAEITRKITHIAYQPAITGERRPQFDLSAHSANPDQSYNTSDTLTMSDSALDRSYGLLYFDLNSVIPPEVRIHSAELEATVKSVLPVGDLSSSDWLFAHAISRRWTELATWNTHDSNKNWRPNGVGEPVYATTPIDSFAGQPVDTIRLDLTHMLRYWLSTQTTFNGVLLRSTNAVNLLELYSLNHSDYSAQPHLNISYSCPCGYACGIQKRRNYLDKLDAQIDSTTMARTCNAQYDYRGSDGDLRWTFQPWTENGDDDNPCSGKVSLAQDPVLNTPDDWQFKLSGNGENLQRKVWLEQAEQVVISFRYRRHGLPFFNQATVLRFSNGSVTETLLTIDDSAADLEYQTASVAVPAALVSRNSSFSFETQNYSALRYIYIDDVKISFEGPVNPVFGLSITADTMISQDKSSESQPIANPLKLKDSTSKRMRIVYSIDTGGLLPGDVIAKATLNAWVDDNRTDRDATLSLYALAQSWDKTQATWNDRQKNITPWSTVGGTYYIPANPADTPRVTLEQGVKDVWIEFDITALVQSWAEFPTSNHGLLLIMEDGARGKDLKLNSLENGDPEFRPRVELQL